MEGQSENASDDDCPISVSFKQLKKDKFVLSRSLKNEYDISRKESVRKTRFRDPRFDPRVNGVCTLSDWTSLSDDQEHALRTLKKQANKAKSDDLRDKLAQAIKLLRQRRATQKDVDIKRRVKRDLQQKQLKDLQAGKRASFITRKELKDKIHEERLKTMSTSETKKYMARRSKTRKGASVLDDDLFCK